MSHNKHRRVVVTGLGVVAPNGVGKTAFWHATRHGISGISHLFDGEHPFSPIQVAGAVKAFSPEKYLDRKLVNRTDRMTHLALAAIQEAYDDARLEMEHEDPRRVGAVIANTLGGVNYVLGQLQALYTRGPRAVSAYTAIAWLHVAPVGQTAIRYGLQGYCKTPVNDLVGGLDALGMAFRAIRRGAADVIIAGGCEAFLHPVALILLARQGHCVHEDDPCAYRPFDQRARGLILAEGAGMCIVEDYEHARARGAPIYGELVGYGQSNDALGFSAPGADGTHYARALRSALQEGSLLPEHIAYISLDGRAAPASDRGEFAALQQVFGDHLPTVPVSVPRTMLGHSYAAAGTIDSITALLALRDGLIPPTINCEELEPYYIFDMVRGEARDMPNISASTAQGVLLGGRGIGGANVALAIKRV